MKTKWILITAGLVLAQLIISSPSYAASPRVGYYLGGTAIQQIAFQITRQSKVDSLTGLVPLTCTASDGAVSSYVLSLTSGAGPIRIRDGKATLRNYRYAQSADSEVTLNGRITGREARLSISLVSPESTCVGSIRQSVTRTAAPIVKNYDTGQSDPRGSVAITFTGTKLTTHVVYVLAVCNDITNVIAAADTAEPLSISYASNGDFTYSVSNTSEFSSISVSVAGIRNSVVDTYSLTVTGSVTNSLGTCPFNGVFEASRK